MSWPEATSTRGADKFVGFPPVELQIRQAGERTAAMPSRRIL